MSIKHNENKVQTLLNNYLTSLNVQQHPQEACKEIFGTKRPDNWFIHDAKLYIFECKCEKKQWQTEAKEQLRNYVRLADKYAANKGLSIIPVFVYGESKELFKMLFVKDLNDDVENNTFVDFSEIFNFEKMSQKPQQTKFDPHIFDNFVYNNFPNISSEDKIKIILSVLLTISSGIDLKPPLALRCIETEKRYGMNGSSGEEFSHLINEPYSSIVNECFKFFATFKDEDLSIILFKCFVEISYWSFKTINGKIEKNKIITDYGAVFTPLDIVNVMINRLKIESTDTVCDPCCGSGSFLYEALKYTSSVIGNELNSSRVLMSRHGLIIKKLFDGCDRIKNVDYMIDEYEPNFDWLLMNPPYKSGTEQKACLKFMKLAKKGGVIIIPLSNFLKTKFKQQICEIVEPLEIIILNKNVFHPMSNVQTAILVFKAKTNESKLNLKIYDFQNDGYEIHINNGRIYTEDTEPIYIRTVSEISGDWCSCVSLDRDEEEITARIVDLMFDDVKVRYINDYKNEIMNMKLDSGELIPPPKTVYLPEIIPSEIKWVRFNKIFCFINGKKITTEENIPLFGATVDNIPSKNVNYYQYISEDNDPIISINSTGDGGCGVCHVMKGKFAVQSRYCFKVDEDFEGDIDYELTAIMMSHYLHDIKGYCRAKGITKTFNEIIPVYIHDM